MVADLDGHFYNDRLARVSAHRGDPDPADPDDVGDGPSGGPLRGGRLEPAKSCPETSPSNTSSHASSRSRCADQTAPRWLVAGSRPKFSTPAMTTITGRMAARWRRRRLAPSKRRAPDQLSPKVVASARRRARRLEAAGREASRRPQSRRTAPLCRSARQPVKPTPPVALP